MIRHILWLYAEEMLNLTRTIQILKMYDARNDNIKYREVVYNGLQLNLFTMGEEMKAKCDMFLLKFSNVGCITHNGSSLS